MDNRAEFEVWAIRNGINVEQVGDGYKYEPARWTWIGWHGHGVAAARVHGNPELHCATCQCARIADTRPVPGNPFSKPWHENAEGKQP